jgi:hypothetical protein
LTIDSKLIIRRRAVPRNAKIAVTAGEVVLFVGRWLLVVPAAGRKGELIKRISTDIKEGGSK